MHEFVEHLIEDHEKQRALGERLKNAADADGRKDMRERMQEELLPHMAGEEASIFPYMRDSGDRKADKHALEAVQEHHAARTVLREIMDLSLESEIFSAKATVLVEMNEHHMDEEESTHFVWLKKHASKEQLDALYEAYEKAEKAEE
ncbi:MAG: hemerythrin domain-containing protein [Coriobacteriia bacterium]|nr:hemerythrin domain-containing protein [Coriobacteriia bacterium]